MSGRMEQVDTARIIIHVPITAGDDICSIKAGRSFRPAYTVARGSTSDPPAISVSYPLLVVCRRSD